MKKYLIKVYSFEGGHEIVIYKQIVDEIDMAKIAEAVNSPKEQKDDK